MRWKAEDLEKLMEMEEYIDTLLYPVCVSPASWDKEWLATQIWLDKVCGAAEKQLTGRIFMYQPLSVPRADDYITTTLPYLIHNLEVMKDRFPFSMLVTNEQELADRVGQLGWNAAVLLPAPVAEFRTKNFVHKAGLEANRIVQQLIEGWKRA
ncbi:hypothetical protein PP175_09395 [Aneurinibacillus sp. Ricciae_BoGa-3]|uniref:hypothetical protein n=1 Tax=Aneurinibacillus sp. Ricciae_BoGa-3 TaxID=3022697 RepID=UPI00233F7C50|nr:hypothetical protein [Aneurinibacillus sp. Ricciae_BoGa-3]WCK56098.1 hypothetical protein PP175_09395 [Aneurinibacillus sp. Ricciae_BoGa-3]